MKKLPIIQLAIGQIFDKEKDFLFPYYRDMLTVLSAGLTPEEIILNGISKAADVAGGGRHMSNHFAKPEWHIQNVSSATGNHTLHAVGVARSIKIYNGNGVAISSQGESSTSEGYVFEAINGAAKEKLPVVFVIQDNKYGISVPQSDQSANVKAAENYPVFRSLYMQIVYVSILILILTVMSCTVMKMNGIVLNFPIRCRVFGFNLFIRENLQKEN